ncbi:MAG: HD domain-containing protein [Nitrospirae bacterium]|nr:HD domain-containing protein [Nitrospirota bacterium]
MKMKLGFCPGAQGLKQPQPEVVKCPSCSEEIEIWTDELQATCPNCKKIVTREAGASCLDWCSYAKECLGAEGYNKYMQNKAITVKGKLLKELELYFGDDKKRINHAQKVMHFAEELLKTEKCDWHIVIPASILHDIGIKEAERKYGSSAGPYQEKEGPAVAKGILLKMGLKKGDIEEICDIIAHHHSPGKIDTLNFKVLCDADWMVNLKDEVKTRDKDKLRRIIDKVFLTEAGRELAGKMYLSSNPDESNEATT